MDFGSSLGAQPLTNVNISPPPVTVISNGIGLIYNQISDNEQAYEKNAEQLFKSLKLAVPAGTELVNINRAYKIYKEGPDENGFYAVRNPDGTLQRNATFKDVFWSALGMPTNPKVEGQELKSDMSKAKFDYSQRKKEILELYQNGLSLINAGHDAEGNKYVERANELISAGADDGLNLTPSGDDFDKYYIPANQRTYDALPASLKPKFAPRVFNGQ